MSNQIILHAPPTEENSLLLQVTVGCSWNRCTFCEMYKDRNFRVRSFAEICADLSEATTHKESMTQIFLCDGDAIAAPVNLLIKVLLELIKTFPNLQSVNAYASARSILLKTPREWEALAIAGLSKVHMGLESGSDTVLRNIQKGISKQEMIQATEMLRNARISLAVTVIVGLGGEKHWKEHVSETVDVLNQMQPDYLGMMTLHTRDQTDVSETPVEQTLDEMLELLSNLKLTNCVFSSGHSSNPIYIQGRLPENQQRLIENMRQYMEVVNGRVVE